MLTKKYIQINKHTSPIRVEYSDNATYYGDTVVTIYDEYKVSLVLSDDCGAVIGNKVYFPKRGDMMNMPDACCRMEFPSRKPATRAASRTAPGLSRYSKNSLV